MKMAKLTAIFIYFTVSCFIGLINCEIKPRLEILPVQTIQRKPVGKSLMLTCRPNVPDPSLVTDLQWRDNSNMTILPKPVGQAPPAMYTETLPGDQTLALLIPSLTEAMQGTYYCSASYANTQLLEVSVKIETYVAITWKDAPENQFPILGSDYKVKCEVTANPPPTVDWLRNGDPIKSGGRYVVEAYGLLIKNVQETDDGIYTCRAAVIQTGELVERNIRVEVYIKPEISALPNELEAIESQSFSTYCNATGKPPPEITWVKDQTQQNILTTGRFLVNPQTGLLTITRVEQEDYGIYTCIAKNAAGSKLNKTKLNVIVQPRIDEFYNGTEAVQKELAITCRAKGRPAPEITFRRWGSEEEYVTGLQPNDDRINLEQYANDELGEGAGTLRISKLLRSDDGLYQCIARNKGGSAYRTGHITVQFPPDFEHMKNLPPVFTWDQKPANLSCLAVSIPNATIEWRWNGQPIRQLQDSNFNIQSNGPLSNLIVTPRDRRYYSVYKCVATNEHGTNEIDIQLKEARRPDYVVSAKPRDVTATSITFEITGPATEIGLPITAYIVHYKEQNMMDWSTAQKREWSPDSPYTVEGLRPQTSYDFRFAARNMVGQGEFGAIITQSTPKRSAPEPPKLLHTPILENDDQPIVISPYSDHFELRWSVPPNNGEPIDLYRVKFCPGFKENGEWHEIENECIERDVIETTNFEMSHLKPSTLHRIELRAHNKIGYSAPASLMMKTARDNPYNSASTLATNKNWTMYLLFTILLGTITTFLSTSIYMDVVTMNFQTTNNSTTATETSLTTATATTVTAAATTTTTTTTTTTATTATSSVATIATTDQLLTSLSSSISLLKNSKQQNFDNQSSSSTLLMSSSSSSLLFPKDIDNNLSSKTLHYSYYYCNNKDNEDNNFNLNNNKTKNYDNNNNMMVVCISNKDNIKNSKIFTNSNDKPIIINYQNINNIKINNDSNNNNNNNNNNYYNNNTSRYNNNCLTCANNNSKSIITYGADVVLKVEKHALSSAAIVGIAVGGVLLLVLIVDFLCCITMRIGLLASMCRKTKRSPSDMDEEAKLGSLYGWRFPLPYCSGQLVKEPPPSPLPLPPPVKLGGSPMASPLDEKQPLNTPTESIKKNSSVEFDGKHVRSRSGEIIGKNSAV